ncbi:acyltransferase family protein [Cronobacter sakazakii]|nr:acyltransferase family protein [Cronobacter sakazakii]
MVIMSQPMLLKKNNERMLFIDSIKGLAIFLVCWGHSIQFVKKAGVSFFENPLFIIIYSFHMPLFMIISGSLFFYSLQRNEMGELIKKKILQLMLPSASWFILESILIGRNINIPNLRYGLIFPFWFLSSLFFLSITMSLSQAVYKGKPWIIFSVIFFISLFFGDSWNMDRTKFMAPYFLLGVSVHYFINYIRSNKHKLGLVSLITWIVMLFFWDKSDYIYITKMSFHGVEFTKQLKVVLFRYAIGFAGCFSIMYLYSYTSKLKLFTLFASSLGIYTLPIYIISTLILSRIANYIDITTYCDNSIIYNFIITPIYAFFIITLCILIAKYLKKAWVTRFLFLGGR